MVWCKKGLLSVFVAALVCFTIRHSATLAALMPSNWGEISLASFADAEVVCAGKVVGWRELKGMAPWWLKYRAGANLQAHEAEFNVDNVMRGSAGLVGQRIKVRYVGSKRGGRNVLPDFANTVGKRRCLVNLIHHGNLEQTYRILGDGGSFMVLGMKPHVEDWEKLTDRQRLEREVASTIADSDVTVARRAMGTAVAAKLTGADVMQALLTRKSDRNLNFAAYAAASLVRMNHQETLCDLVDLLGLWGQKAAEIRCVIGSALEDVRDPDAVPVLVRLSRVGDTELRAGAVCALRKIRSDKAVAALAAGLEDTNELTRYHAVMGLAYQTRRMNPEWAWGFPRFQENPRALTKKWKDWWEKGGKRKYPSVKDVIEEFEQKRGELRRKKVENDVRQVTKSAPESDKDKKASRIAILPGQGERAPSELIIAMLEEALSQETGVVLVERAEVRKILREQELSLLFAAENLRERIAVGHLLKADLLVFLEEHREGKIPCVQVRICETGQGLRLLSRPIPLSGDAEADIEVMLKRISYGRRKHVEGIREVCAIPPFVSNDLTHEFDHFQRAMAHVIEQYLLQQRGVVVVELQEARTIAKEQLLSGDTGRVQHAMPLFVMGEYRNNLVNGQPRTDIRLAFQRGAKALGHFEKKALGHSQISDFLLSGVREFLTEIGQEGTLTASPTDEAKVLVSIQAH